MSAEWIVSLVAIAVMLAVAVPVFTWEHRAIRDVRRSTAGIEARRLSGQVSRASRQRAQNPAVSDGAPPSGE